MHQLVDTFSNSNKYKNTELCIEKFDQIKFLSIKIFNQADSYAVHLVLRLSFGVVLLF